jgi:PAS domain S-box-containing protein
MSRAIASGKVIPREELRYLRGDGSFCWMRISGAPLYSAGENPTMIGGLAVCEDITVEHDLLEERLEVRL